MRVEFRSEHVSVLRLFRLETLGFVEQDQLQAVGPTVQIGQILTVGYIEEFVEELLPDLVRALAELCFRCHGSILRLFIFADRHITEENENMDGVDHAE